MMISRKGIAKRKGLSMSAINHIATSKDWPPALEKRGRFMFYDVIDIDKFFASRIDRRRKEFK